MPRANQTTFVRIRCARCSNFPFSWNLKCRLPLAEPLLLQQQTPTFTNYSKSNKQSPAKLDKLLLWIYQNHKISNTTRSGMQAVFAPGTNLPGMTQLVMLCLLNQHFRWCRSRPQHTLSC